MSDQEIKWRLDAIERRLDRFEQRLEHIFTALQRELHQLQRANTTALERTIRERGEQIKRLEGKT